MENIPEDLWKWLNEDVHVRDMDDKNLEDYKLYELEELQKMLKERIYRYIAVVFTYGFAALF